MNAFDLRLELLKVAFRNDLSAEAIVERAKVFEEYVNPSEAEGGEPLRRKRGRPPITKGSEPLL
jgi:hypothetical protein